MWSWTCSVGFGTWNDGFSHCCFMHRRWNSFFDWLMLYVRLQDPILWLCTLHAWLCLFSAVEEVFTSKWSLLHVSYIDLNCY